MDGDSLNAFPDRRFLLGSLTAPGLWADPVVGGPGLEQSHCWPLAWCAFRGLASEAATESLLPDPETGSATGLVTSR